MMNKYQYKVVAFSFVVCAGLLPAEEQQLAGKPLGAAVSELEKVTEETSAVIEDAKKLLEKAAAPLKYEFKKDPVYIKGAGSCEGIEFADLNKDGVRDVVVGIPRGSIQVSYGVKGEKGITYGERQVLKNKASGKDIHIKHW